MVFTSWVIFRDVGIFYSEHFDNFTNKITKLMILLRL
jgi:hypothetical protein